MPQCAEVSCVEQRYIHRVGKQLGGHPVQCHPHPEPLRAGFLESFPDGFLISPWMENLQPPWQPMAVLRHALSGKRVS